MQTTYKKDHLFNRFMWGNLKSLKGQNEETLWDDLRTFFETQYSADRMRLVIQVKTRDNMRELWNWVVNSFSIIENKSLGI